MLPMRGQRPHVRPTLVPEAMTVTGIPTTFDARHTRGAAMFRLRVTAASGESPSYELKLAWPTTTWFRGTGLAIRPLGTSGQTGTIHGCLELEGPAFMLLCDHRTEQHRTRAVDLGGRGLKDLRDVLGAIAWGRTWTGKGRASYLRQRLEPLAEAVVEAATRSEEDVSVPVDLPFPLLPPGAEWESDDAPRISPHGLVVRTPVMAPPILRVDPEGTELERWTDFDVMIGGIDEDHAWYRTFGDSGRPGGDWTTDGWLTWADGSVLACGRDDYEQPPVFGRIPIPGFPKPTPSDPRWWLSVCRAVVLATAPW